MSSIVYPGGTTVNVTFATAVKADILTNVKTQLLAAGWSTISSSSTVVVMQTANTPQGLNIRCRMQDNGANCICFSIESAVSGATQPNNNNSGGFLIPGGTFRIVANQYQFCCYQPSSYGSGRMFILVSCPFIPAPASNSLPTAAGLLFCDSANDGFATQLASFRTGLNTSVANSFANNAAIYGASIMANANNTNANSASIANLLLPYTMIGFNQSSYSASNNNATKWRNANNDTMTFDALVLSGLSLPTDIPQVWAQLWGAVIRYNSYVGDYTDSFDGHSWITPQNNAPLSSFQPVAQLFLATS